MFPQQATKAMEDAANTDPDVPEDRRMTRGMKAAGGVIPPVLPPVKKRLRVQKSKPIDIKPEDSKDNDSRSSQDPYQFSVKRKKTKSEYSNNLLICPCNLFVTWKLTGSCSVAPPFDPTDP